MSTKLRYFVRLDGNGNIVPGSLIARRRGQNRPGRNFNGRWMEITNPRCCGDGVFTAEIVGDPGDILATVSISIECSNLTLYSLTGDPYITLQEVVDLLNTLDLGIFTLEEEVITLTNPVCTNITDFTVTYTVA